MPKSERPTVRVLYAEVLELIRRNMNAAQRYEMLKAIYTDSATNHVEYLEACKRASREAVL